MASPAVCARSFATTRTGRHLLTVWARRGAGGAAGVTVTFDRIAGAASSVGRAFVNSDTWLEVTNLAVDANAGDTLGLHVALGPPFTSGDCIYVDDVSVIVK